MHQITFIYDTIIKWEILYATFSLVIQSIIWITLKESIILTPNTVEIIKHED